MGVTKTVRPCPRCGTTADHRVPGAEFYCALVANEKFHDDMTKAMHRALKAAARRKKKRHA